MNKKEFAQALKEQSKTKWGTFDLRTVLPKYNTIEELREIVDAITSEFSDAEIKKTWSLSDERTHDDVKTICNGMLNAVGPFYDMLKNDFDVITIDETDDEIGGMRGLKTFIVNTKYLQRFHFKYSSYDSLLYRYVKEYADKADGLRKTLSDEEHFKQIAEDAINSGKDAVLVRFIYPDERIQETGSIQIFPIDIADSLKANIYMPWGPYELTEFVVGRKAQNLIKISADELETRILKFISKYGLKSVLADA